MIDSGGLQQAKLVLLGDMGAGKSSLVLRFVKGQFFDYQVPAVKQHSSWVLSHRSFSQPNFRKVCGTHTANIASGVNDWGSFLD